MNDQDITHTPAALDAILRDSAQIGFALASEPKTGALTRTSTITW